MTVKDEALNRFTLELSDHSAEGIEILASEPSRLIHYSIYLMVLVLLSGFLWSFIGEADVIVSSQGKLIPDSSVRPVFSPLKGELVEVYVSEGMPIQKGDVIARVKAMSAVQIAQNMLSTQHKLDSAQRAYDNFPDKKALLERKVESLKQRHEIAKAIYDKRVDAGLAMLTEEQKILLKKKRTELNKAGNTLNKAQQVTAKYQRLFDLPGGGGVSKATVGEKQKAATDARIAYQLAQAALAELEIKLSKDHMKEESAQMSSAAQLSGFKIEYETERQKIIEEEERLITELKAAKIANDAAEKVNLDNIDEDGFLRIDSPYSGIITQVSYTQPGDQIEPKRPLVGIAPDQSQMMLELAIPENNRGLLREGTDVKIKFAAFPYQRFGFIEGHLDYISPSTVIERATKKSIYKGHVSLDKTFFMIDGANIPLRYGMTAKAEIIVRKRRLIDMALDPLRGLSN